MNIEREIALQALLEFRKSGAWPDLYLKNKLADVDRAQAALATNITYGVLQKQSLLDFYIGHFSSIKLPKIPVIPEVIASNTVSIKVPIIFTSIFQNKINKIIIFYKNIKAITKPRIIKSNIIHIKLNLKAKAPTSLYFHFLTYNPLLNESHAL